MYNNQKCRMDWCVKPYDQANHHPLAVLNGHAAPAISVIDAAPGETVKLDATGSHDPDGDPIELRWYPYDEAGTYEGELRVEEPNAISTSITIPADAASCELHVILEVKDLNPIGSLFDYRRLVINVNVSDSIQTKYTSERITADAKTSGI